MTDLYISVNISNPPKKDVLIPGMSRFNMPAMFIIIQRHKTGGIESYSIRYML